MTYNEWCEYAQFGQACEYDNQMRNFVEHYTNAKHQEFLDQQENDRSNRQIQGVTTFWQERGHVQDAYGDRPRDTIKFQERPHHQEVYTPVLRWLPISMGEQQWTERDTSARFR